ncbi:molybdate ABC transporter substrate-binding protein [Wenzhouxiangella sp. XN79A]|uniref:molybdate ABC transporter substrate-binding protein n=1 Tax=Wenzhouxiangella sp. XN79A TaxID=2724193 RepID=UPI00144A79D7|nr:molybdate ABC transporter substrate-binding protein [Wenzhouxiangella sp. XN79A]NKI34909.1 molybdate ABC transporter substrate-binding protein [Wenzhouxiangella sp. XN79A]
MLRVPASIVLAAVGLFVVGCSGDQEEAGSPLRLAVASNFAEPARRLAEAFEAQTGTTVEISNGSTGKLYHQIRSGAPFHVFLAADRERPTLLAEAGLGRADTLFEYAAGILMLWIPGLAAGEDCLAALPDLEGRISMANAEIAPYGLAAEQALMSLGLWSRIEPRRVIGENIGQTFLFVSTGNAAAGLIAGSQAVSVDRGCLQEIDADLHEPISQYAVQVAEHPQAPVFVEFLASESSRDLIRGFRYRTGPAR